MTSPFDAPPGGGASELPPPTRAAPPAPPGSPVPPSGPPPAPPSGSPASPAPATPPATPAPAPPSPSTPPAAAGAAAPVSPGPTEPAPAPARDQDLDDLLDRLHDEMDLERSQSAAVGTGLTDARDLERPQGDTVVVETDGGIHFDPTFAGFPARFIGYVIDAFVVGIAVLPGLLLMTSDSLALILLGLIVATLGFCAVTAWAARSIASTGRWIGNRVTSTSIVDTRTGRSLTTSAAAGRMVIRHLVSPILLVGFLPAFVDPQRRTLHDRVATSIVVTRPREVWTAGGGDSPPTSKNH